MHNNFHGYLANPWPCRSVNSPDSLSFKFSPINHKCLSEKSRGALHLDEVVFLIPGSYPKSELTWQVSYRHSVLPRSQASVQIQMHVPLVFFCLDSQCVTQSEVRSSSRAAIGDGTSLHVRRPVVSRPWKGRILITMGVLFPYGFSSVFKGYFDLLRSLAVSAAQLMFQSKRLCLVWLTWSRCALRPAVRCSCICT